jgi:hypothetical protein
MQRASLKIRLPFKVFKSFKRFNKMRELLINSEETLLCGNAIGRCA